MCKLSKVRNKRIGFMNLLYLNSTKYPMKYFTLLFCFFLISNSLYAQDQKLAFPENSVGIYKGDIHISSARGNQTIPMEFHLKATKDPTLFDYVLVYNSSFRNYTLRVIDKEKGVYEVDENNGIILPTKLAGNTLYSFFEVQGNILTSRLAFSKNKIDFEILFTPIKNKVKTGGTSKEVPVVFGYPITTVQKAILQKTH